MRRLYLRLERPQFYALFGDYDTGIDEPELARYVRSMNGLKAEYRSDRVSATAFAADTPNRHRRDEIQGNGLSGPYALGSRDILANCEHVVIEIRDRLHSDRIVESRLLTRHIDYDIDYARRHLALPRADPQPLLEPRSAIHRRGLRGRRHCRRASSTPAAASPGAAPTRRCRSPRPRSTTMTATARTDLGGVDVRYRPTASTEIRAEAAVSDTHAASGNPAPAQGGTATAWQIEAEHHDRRFDVLAYAREREAGFGVGQLNASENGTRKIGVDARARLAESLSLTGSAWHEDYLGQRRRAHRRPRPDRISRPQPLGARRHHHRRRPARRRAQRQLADPAARRHQAPVRQPAGTGRADRAADRRA